MSMQHVLIGGAWPYTNGSLHIGHIAALLPGDVLARYFRMCKKDVYYVSGSDCHGTPVTIRARKEGRTPQEISDQYHQEFCSVFAKLGFSYDVYGQTSAAGHKAFVRSFHQKMYKSPYVYEKTMPQAYCPACQAVLTDRMLLGACPVCGGQTRGEQCEICNAMLEAEHLRNPVCGECKSPVEFTNQKHLYIAISALESTLRAYLGTHPEWRKNAIAFTQRYLDEGLRDRAITRHLDWGIDVPKEGYGDKKIYIWAENVLGYLSASAQAAQARGTDLAQVWGTDARHYYVHGKDNIPFHTIILPSLLLAHGGGWRLPDTMISSEYLTLEGRRISTSQNWAIWAKDIVDRYNPDALRYFFLANGPEKRDTDFSWREFVERNNGELLGCYGNFIHRTLVFINKYYNSAVPPGVMPADWQERFAIAFAGCGAKIEEGRLKDALESIFELARTANQYYDQQAPWKTRTGDPAACSQALFACVQMAANLSVLLSPFLPFSSAKVANWLGLRQAWEMQQVPAGAGIPEVTILFERLDKKIMEVELARLR